VAPEVPAPRVTHGPPQHGVIGVPGVVVAGVDLGPVPVRVAQVDIEGVGHPVPARPALDATLLPHRSEDVADPQHLMRFVREEPQVVQARPVSPGERHVVHGLLAVHPGGVQRLGVLDRLGQAEPEGPVVRKGGTHVGHDDVEVVKSCDLGAAPQVVALLQPFGVLGVEEELDREAERVLRPHRFPYAWRDPGPDPPRPAAERRVERFRQVQIGGGPHPEGEPSGGRFRSLAQDQVMVRELVITAQVQRIRVVAGDDEAEQVDPEPPGCVEVGDDKLRVGGPDDIGRCEFHDHAPNRGTCVSSSGMWMIRDSV
jgi:hypothetical protein